VQKYYYKKNEDEKLISISSFVQKVKKKKLAKEHNEKRYE